ncbi:MAG: hypothetical protein JW760_08760 [Spirochaetales bacterium]|nr:hypothetical protein [Spirochaetales bacterium]
MDQGQYDHLVVYCGMLGHQVPFSYCRKPGSEVSCSRIAGCWAGMIPPRDLPAIPPTAGKSKLDRILEAVELAKSR